MLGLPTGRAPLQPWSKGRAGDAPAPAVAHWGASYTFGGCMVRNFCNMSHTCYFPALAKAQAVCWTLSGNQQYHCTTQQFGNTLKIPPLAFECEHVPAYYMGLDKLVKWWRLTFAPGEKDLYLEKLSDIRMIHLLLEANCLAFLQVKLNSCCWHENQGRQAE